MATPSLQKPYAMTTENRRAPRRLLDRAPRLAYLLPVMAEKQNPNYKVIAENRRARFDYFIESDVETGIVLTGSEVKSR